MMEEKFPHKFKCVTKDKYAYLFKRKTFIGEIFYIVLRMLNPSPIVLLLAVILSQFFRIY